MPLVTIDLNDAGRTCPYCRFQFQEGEIAYKCDACGSLHHDDCWAEGSGCAMLGCQMNAATQAQFVQQPPIQHVPQSVLATAPALAGFVTQPKAFNTPSAAAQMHANYLYDYRVAAAFAAVTSAIVLWLVDMPTGLSYGALYNGTSEAGYILVTAIWPALGGALLCFAICTFQLAMVGEWKAAFARTGSVVPLLCVALYAADAVISFGQSQVLDAFEYSAALVHVLSSLGASVCGALIGFAVGKSSGSSANALRCLTGGLLGGLLSGALNSLLFSAQLGLSAELLPLLVFSTGVALGVAILNVLRREAWVKISSGRFAGMDQTISNTPSMIGTSPRSEVLVPRDLSVAPTHAALDWRNGSIQAAEGMTLVVDDAPTVFGQLRPGSNLVVGETEFQYFERPTYSSDGYFAK